MSRNPLPGGLGPEATALESLVAIQRTGGRAEMAGGWIVDHELRRLAVAGVDLASVPAATVVVPEPPAAAHSPVTAVLMAGGRGSRLAPLTFKVPKPLLMVGRTTLLERLLECLAQADITDVWISVNYMAEQIEARVGDGGDHGVAVRYLREDEPLWTAGALSLLPDVPAGPILVLNTDQITNLNFARLVEYHVAEAAAVTVAAVAYEVQVPYGVLAVEGTRLTGLEEKPTARFQCNGGYYVVEPEILAMIPVGKPMTMVDLMQAVLDQGRKVAVFPILETWIDIGTPDDLQRALLTFATGEEL